MFNFKGKKSFIAMLVIAMFMLANVAMASAAGQVTAAPPRWAGEIYGVPPPTGTRW